MPELPEVETVCRELDAQLRSRRIVDVRVLWARTVDRPNVSAFCRALVGACVSGVGRRGKFVTLQLDTGQTLLVHLRMTGQLLIRDADADLPADTHVRVYFRLGDGRWLLFSDTRKFGRMYLVDDPLAVVGDLGPEPLEEDFTAARLGEMLKGRRGRIKPLLLNQNFLAGLGNIYADEALWRAQVHPLRAADTLSPTEIGRLHAGIVSVLRAALEKGGTSLRDNQYRQPNGQAGAYQELLAVYGRAGGACLRCGATVERIVVGQRGTHLCPRCQVLRPSHS